MADQKENIGTNTFVKSALVTDLDSSFVNKESYTHARNIDSCGHEGNMGTKSNSMSNTLCINLTFPFIGSISLNDDRFVIFSGNGIISEIGILDERFCTYERKISSSCLNFNPCEPITGEAKKTDEGHTIIYFRDNINEMRRINLDRVPYTYTLDTDECKTKIYTTELDCEETKIFPNITPPCIALDESPVGNLPNGVYSAVMAYNVDNQIYSDYYGITTRIQLYSKGGGNGFTATITDLDRDFTSYDLVIIQDINGSKTAFRLGSFPTSQSNVSVDDLQTTSTVNISDIVVQKRTWEKAGIISANSNYLLFADLTKKAVLNYQPQAMKIEPEYVVEQVAEDYYERGPKDVGYYRDENYEFFIQWLYKDGTFSHKYHIPGPKKTTANGAMASGADVYETDDRYFQQDPNILVERWEVDNMAGLPIFTNNQFVNGRRIYAYGEMGYSESTDEYADVPELYGEDACKPIRHPKFPDECKIGRYSVIDGKTYINILGVRFKKIQYPKDVDGNIIPNIVGYRIIRSDRTGGNKTVIARGLATNMRHYMDRQNNKQIWYANYPYNDLSPDQFISETQTVYKNGHESNFTPLSGVHNDKFAFYTPHAYFQPTYKLGTEFKFETEEIANVDGYFEPTQGHPRHALLTQFAFWISLTIGTIEAILIENGRKCIETNKNLKKGGTDTGSQSEIKEIVCVQHAEDILGLDPVQMLKDALSAGKLDFKEIIKRIKLIIKAIAVAGLKVAMFGFNALQYAENAIKIIQGFTSEIQYAYQYNSHALFNKSKCITKDNKRRITISRPERITSNLHTIEGTTLNNFGKQNFMLVQTNKSVKFPTTIDNTRRTITGFGVCDNPTQPVKSIASAYYATSKIRNRNQYGQPGSATSVLCSNCVEYITLDPENTEELFTSGIIYGGDCIITKFAVQTKQQLFRQNLATTIGNELGSNYPDGIEYDYRLYRNIGYARYWIDSNPYEFGSLLSKNVMNFSKFSRTTTSKYNLDCKFADRENIFRVDNSRFYTSNNGILEFYVESDYNISFREEAARPHYSKHNGSLSEIFKPPLLWFDEEFKLDLSFTRLQTTEIFSQQLPDTFRNIDNANLRMRNAVIYSLPSFNSQTVDNWRYFLPNNYFTFSQSDYGNLTAIHKIDQDRILYLFDRSSPFVSPGRDEIQTLDGRKVQVGDGGMFAKDPREAMPTDVNYGSCQSKYAFSSNQFGYFYPAEYHGRYFNFTKGLDDLAHKGMHYWHKTYMPIRLYDYFPTYPRTENPLCGVGYLMAFDSSYEKVYLTKRDYIPKSEYVDRLSYNNSKNRFEYNGAPISLLSTFFDDISWTSSYDPTEEGGFVSWHDWHPNWIIQTEKHFMTVRGTGIWKHNQTCDSYCNYYGIDYPFEIEFVDSDGQIINTRRNIEYQLEAYRYKNNCRDKFHMLNENFDHMIVHNTEQASPPLVLVPNPQTKYGANDYPRRVGNKWEVLFSKEENKYRTNQFWSSIRDRGEFTSNEFHIWVNHQSGYKRVQNPLAIDLNKPENQRAKFRHYFTRFWLAREISGNIKFFIKLINVKKQFSPR